MGLFSKQTESVETLKARRAALVERLADAQAKFGPARERLAVALVAGENSTAADKEFDALAKLISVGPGAIADLDKAIERRPLQDEVDAREAAMSVATRARAKFEASARKLKDAADLHLKDMVNAIHEVVPCYPRVVGRVIHALASDKLAEAAENSNTPVQFYGVIRALEEKGAEIEKFAQVMLEEAQEKLAAFDAGS